MLAPTAARVPLARAARPALAAAAAPVRWLNFKLFDNIIPEDDPETKERKDRERRIVKQKMQRSKFADMFAAQKGKNLVATADVLPPAAERLFPALATATPIADGTAPPLPLPAAFAQRPLTLVTLAFQAMGQEQLRPWHADFMERFAPGTLLVAPGAGGEGGGGDDMTAPAPPAAAAPAARAHPSAQQTPVTAGAAGRVGLLNIVYLEGWAWRALGPLVRGGMARALQPPGLAARTVMVLEPSEKTTDHFCDGLLIDNRVMGHLFLVDAGGHVRWRAQGLPAPGELDALAAATETLVRHAPGGAAGGKRRLH